MKNLKVELGANSYPIYVGENIISKLGEMIQLFGIGSQAVVAITDSNIEKLHKTRMLASLCENLDLADLIVIPAGEKSKRLSVAERVLTRLLEKRYDRNLTILAVGGGVVGDLSGFVASIYKRGVNYIQVPTTLLAQVDSSVGGKTGVNHATGKNLIGTFYQPKLVWADLAFLKSLPRPEIACGLAEVVKHGIIRDAELFAVFEKRFDDFFALNMDLLEYAVLRSCEIKSDVVSQDEHEGGLRMILNFGHTIGHALEGALGYQRITHGEGVLMGMLAESRMAAELGLLSQSDFDRIEQVVMHFDLTGKLFGLKSDRLHAFVKTDKKVADGRVKFVLPKKIGDVKIVDNVDTSLMELGIAHALSRFGS